MATRRKPSSAKRSLSLRSSSFIRLISPFRGASRAVRESAESNPPSPFPVRGSVLQAALSDSQLDAWARPQEKEVHWVSQQELRFRGPLGQADLRASQGELGPRRGPAGRAGPPAEGLPLPDPDPVLVTESSCHSLPLLDFWEAAITPAATSNH